MAVLNKLSPADIRNAKHPGTTTEDVLLSDGGKLYLRLRANGTRDWVFRYTDAKGQRPKLSLGHYPDTSADEARELAAEHRKTLKAGIDPKTERDAAKEAERVEQLLAVANDAPKTVKELCQRWLDGYLDKNRKDGGVTTLRQFEQHLWPYIGDIPLANLRRGHIAGALDKVHATGRTRTCGQLLSNFRQMCAWGIAREWLQVDPTLVLKSEDWQGRAREKDRFLTLKEITQLAQIMALSDLPPRWQHTIWFILATGPRVGETMFAEVSHFSFEANGTGTWFIPAANQKQTNGVSHDFEIHLAPFARAQVEALLALSPKPEPYPDGRPRKHWLLPGREGGHANEKTLAHLLKDRQRGTVLKGRKKASTEFVLSRGEWTVHDLRRTMSTQMGELRVPREVIDLCQNHVIGGKEGKVSRIYQRSPRWLELVDAWTLWDSTLAKLKREAETAIRQQIDAKWLEDFAREERNTKVKARRQRAAAIIINDDDI